jgi:hypothetical protein
MRSAAGWKMRWDETELHKELATALREQASWPSQREFEAIGRLDLYHAVQRRGGVLEWSKRLGLDLRPAQAHRPTSYTTEDAASEASALITVHGYLPGARKLRVLGHGRLAGYINWHHGSSTAYVRAQDWGANERLWRGPSDGPA